MTRRLGLWIIGLTAFGAIAGPWLVPHDPNVQLLAQRLAGPSWTHPLGLDELGRDVFARLLMGARISLFVGLSVVTVSAALGIAIGATAGYAGGRVDNIVGRVMDVLMAFPG
ncbi:MAG TPA: dipeptide ABC transporter permease DppC, partial [Vicinamibacterales bacterium]|nr:dipeptide ABC transporter permease DppC [Vicinamibacterales bacterium]